MNRVDHARAAAEDLTRAGGRDAQVEIVEYDPAWPTRFAAELERIGPLLEGVEIHHFGSTAVPGLAAKSVIDMIALVDNLDTHIAALTTGGGYEFPRAFNATREGRDLRAGRGSLARRGVAAAHAGGRRTDRAVLWCRSSVEARDRRRLGRVAARDVEEAERLTAISEPSSTPQASATNSASGSVASSTRSPASESVTLGGLPAASQSCSTCSMSCCSPLRIVMSDTTATNTSGVG
jgi:GrpB-like predicted nucleotidyltransferase (UPF0157 family)